MKQESHIYFQAAKVNAALCTCVLYAQWIIMMIIYFSDSRKGKHKRKQFGVHLSVYYNRKG